MVKKRIIYKKTKIVSKESFDTGETDKEKHFIHPVYDRKLVRPDINWKKAILFAVGIFLTACLMAGGIFAYIFDCKNENYNRYDALCYGILVLWCVYYLDIMCSRIIAIWMIKVYQRYASAQTRLMCCYIPSCSEYAILAINKYGTFYGSCKALNRIIKCGSYGGEDYP